MNTGQYAANDESAQLLAFRDSLVSDLSIPTAHEHQTSPATIEVTSAELVD